MHPVGGHRSSMGDVAAATDTTAASCHIMAPVPHVSGLSAPATAATSVPDPCGLALHAAAAGLARAATLEARPRGGGRAGPQPRVLAVGLIGRGLVVPRGATV